MLFPISLTNLQKHLCIVIGGGPVGERKVRNLLAVDAKVRLVSPDATAQLHAWAESGRIEWRQRPYQPGDLPHAFLVFAATNVRSVNAQIASDAAAAGALCNVADAPDEGDFHVPAVHRGDGVVVAVSTEDGTPRRAKAVRDGVARAIKVGDAERLD